MNHHHEELSSHRRTRATIELHNAAIPAIPNVICILGPDLLYISPIINGDTI